MSASLLQGPGGPVVFTGICVGGPMSGKSMSAMSDHHVVAVPPEEDSAPRADNPPNRNPGTKFTYRHQVGIRGNGLVVDFWVPDDGPVDPLWPIREVLRQFQSVVGGTIPGTSLIVRGRGITAVIQASLQTALQEMGVPPASEISLKIGVDNRVVFNPVITGVVVDWVD